MAQGAVIKSRLHFLHPHALQACARICAKKLHFADKMKTLAVFFTFCRLPG
jgi:hypothetical protein